MFRQQLRAILRAGAHGQVRILIPMVAHLSEVRQTLDALARARQQLDDAGRAYGPVEIGAMVEVPAAALMLPAFLRHFDFVSIGTNDLIQYTLAIDRADESRRPSLQPLAPGRAATGRADDRASDEAAARTSASAARWRAIRPSRELLLGMGLRSFSMHPSQIVTVKERVLATDTSEWSRGLGAHPRGGRSRARMRGDRGRVRVAREASRCQRRGAL